MIPVLGSQPAGDQRLIHFVSESFLPHNERLASNRQSVNVDGNTLK